MILDSINDNLLKPFTIDEIEILLYQMVPFNALGLNRYGTCFYQTHWKIVGNDVKSTFLSVLNDEVDNMFFIKYIILIIIELLQYSLH